MLIRRTATSLLAAAWAAALPATACASPPATQGGDRMAGWESSSAWRDFKASYEAIAEAASRAAVEKAKARGRGAVDALARALTPPAATAALANLLESRVHARLAALPRSGPPRREPPPDPRRELSESLGRVDAAYEALRALREMGGTDRWIDDRLGRDLGADVRAADRAARRAGGLAGSPESAAARERLRAVRALLSPGADISRWRDSEAWREFKELYAAFAGSGGAGPPAPLLERAARWDGLAGAFPGREEVAWALEALLDRRAGGSGMRLDPSRSPAEADAALVLSTADALAAARALKGLRDLGAGDPWIDGTLVPQTRGAAAEVESLLARVERDPPPDPGWRSRADRAREALQLSRAALSPP